MGIELKDNYIYTLQFADDQAILAGDQEDMEYMVRKLVEEYNEWGLTVNLEKTKYLRIGGPPGFLDLENGHRISCCRDYVYLGVRFDESGTDIGEIEKRITSAKKNDRMSQQCAMDWGNN
ncbi:uncharacterized protein LOC123314054 [Coccinella septempunctata]|uniref:uncharacterized protein LOC123314054 n=1 Tax=Coccinella septempunctata TaxID=41139 RepID=UPI001D07F2E7|nr:uncharacterized protein LOC123314054 [Coccinella septempunctata]